ncbi:MAG TPA: TlpA disulfide reductase family protein [Pyrinomonadaceae bacterium]|nr:TlpA disulfide reductase family protein [Pyrinomonadaceae bacterium]
MKRILRPIIVLPVLAGIISFSLIFLKIWERRKENLLFKDSSASNSSLPKGRLINLQTNQDDYEKLKKGKVLLVFLTRGCDACKKEIPNIAQALPNLVPRMAVYGVYIEERSEVASFVQENQITFPVLLDNGGRIFGALGITLIPAKVLIENGTITKTWFGSSPNKSALIKDVGEVERP